MANVLKMTMGEPPFDRVFYRAKHVVPSRAECIRRLLPRESLGPAGQEPSVTGREMLLALAPRRPFDGHATRRQDAL